MHGINGIDGSHGFSTYRSDVAVGSVNYSYHMHHVSFKRKSGICRTMFKYYIDKGYV